MRGNWACEFFLVFGLVSGVLIGRAFTESSPAPKPSLAQLRYDARQICLASSQWKQEATAQAEEQRRFLTNEDGAAADLTPYRDEWLRNVQTYLSDQRALEQARHITTPNYQDMANVVCLQ